MTSISDNPTEPTTDHEKYVLKTYSLRADGERDLLVLLQSGYWFPKVAYEPYIPIAPDTMVEFQTNATMAQIMEVLEKHPELHIMRQTIRQCPLKENLLERNHDID